MIFFVHNLHFSRLGMNCRWLSAVQSVSMAHESGMHWMSYKCRNPLLLFICGVTPLLYN